jgi:hypothetical protein
LRKRECRIGQRTATRFVACAADGGLFEIESFVEPFEDLDRFGHDLGTDAVTG